MSSCPARHLTARILVVGDVMLDRYWFGEVSRISPEAPVPVVKVERTEERPGGAANVARNCAALGREGLPALRRRRRRGRPVAGALMAARASRPACTRTRSCRPPSSCASSAASSSCCASISRTAPTHEVLRAKLADFERQLPRCDVVILSDYGKGGLATSPR
jgi:bifunctional ADP-heptose synthase (sugar kinase/adenylyltransferase)